MHPTHLSANSRFNLLNVFLSILVHSHSCFGGICSNVNVRHSWVGNRLPRESSSLVVRVQFEYRFQTARSGKAGFLTSSLRLLMVCGSQSGWPDFQTACRSVSQWPVQPSPCLTYLSHQKSGGVKRDLRFLWVFISPWGRAVQSSELALY